MKVRINFDVEPNTTYIVHAHGWNNAMDEARDLARRLHRSAWTVTAGKDAARVVLDAAPTVQMA